MGVAGTAGNVAQSVHYSKRTKRLHGQFPNFLSLEINIVQILPEDGGLGPSAPRVTWDTADDLVIVNLSSFSFYICFIQDAFPFYR